MTDKRRTRQELPKPRTIMLSDNDYQPPKVEREKEHDLPGASLKTIRGEFFLALQCPPEKCALTSGMYYPM